ncbi:L-selectin [Folsomia candida]|uniref:L-selectin n=1 Tax=Folsomia candida TaxID=158441 RepID=A0A226CYA0_FOLCA|nr:L-selectin [Folsomia candida]
MLKLIIFGVVTLLSSIIPAVFGQQCSVGRTLQYRDPRGVTHNYLFSWENPPTASLELDWDGANSVCRRHCMNLVSLESAAENTFVKQHISSGRKRYIWTSGRKTGQSWTWTGSGVGIGLDRRRSDWSHTGGAGIPQPDNRENNPRLEGYNGIEESCLAIFNNFYNDGLKWHDVS